MTLRHPEIRTPTALPSAHALEQMPLAAYATDARGVIRAYNRLAADLWGRAPAPGSPADRYCVAAAAFRFDGVPLPLDQTPVAQVLRDGVARADQELIIQRPDGARAWLSMNVGPVLDEQGGVAGAVCCFRDVSTRKSIERAFHEADARYRRIVETSLDGIWSIDRDRRTTYVNQNMARMLGYEPEEMLGQTPEAFVHADDLPLLDTPRERCLAGFSERNDVRLRRKDGSSVHVALSSCPFKDDAGAFAGAFATCRDVTRERAAAALHTGQRRVLELLATGGDLEPVLAALVETIEAQSPGIVCAILRVDPADPARLVFGTCRSVPPAYRAAISHVPIAADSGTCGAAAFRRRLCVTRDIAADPNWAAHGHLPLGSGLRAVWSVPIITGSGKLLGTFACYFREVREPTPELIKLVEDAAHLAGIAIEQHTGQQELRDAMESAQAAREAAEAASRAKDDFLAALSHELRTPLSPVLLTASALAHDPTLPQAVREDVELIQRSVELEARLIDDLLDLTRITRGKLQLHPEAVDAHALLRQAVHTCCGSDVDNKSLHIELQLGATHPTVLADPARLQQVFWNLLKNAVKFTPAGGHLTILTRDGSSACGAAVGPADPTPPNPRLVVEVRDTGIGIEPAALPTIFDAFQQADGSIGKRFGGLGLGLAICRSLVDLHGGTIRAASAGAGQGSTFTLELPAVAACSLRRTADVPPPDVPGGLKILLVEDHDTTLKVLTKLLRRMGHDVTPAGTCQGGLAAAAAAGAAFDVLVSDIGLPDGTGHQLLAKVRPLQPRLKTIALSGFGMDHDIRQSLDAGFHTHLVKPVHFEKLKGAIAQLFA